MNAIGHIYKYYSSHWLVIDEVERTVAGSADQSTVYAHLRLSCLEDGAQVDVPLTVFSVLAIAVETSSVVTECEVRREAAA